MRMRAEDALFLDIEQPGIPQHVGAVLMLDPRPDGSVPTVLDVVEFVRETPGLNLRLTRPGRWRPARVEVGPAPDVAGLVQVLPAGGRSLAPIADDWFARPLDLSGPAAAFLLVTGLSTGSALLLKVHHALGDGVVVLRTLLAHARGSGPRRVEPTPAERLPVGRVLRGVLGLARAGRAPHSTFDGPVSPGRHLAMVDLSADQLFLLAGQTRAAEDEVLLALLAEKLYETGAEDVPVVRAMMPRSTRTRRTLAATGNYTGAVRVPVPVDRRIFGYRALTIRQAREKQLRKGALEAAVAVIRVIGRLPGPLRRLASRRAYCSTWFNLIASVLPGPRRVPMMLGCSCPAVYPVLPLAPRMGLSVGFLAWGDRICVCLTVDDSRAGLADRLAAAMRETLAPVQSQAGARESSG